MCNGEAASSEQIGELLAGANTQKWICDRLPALSTLSMQSDAAIILKFGQSIDALLWQLQQLEMKKSVEFENVARRFTGQLPTISGKLKELRTPHGGNVSPLQQVIGQLTSTEEQVQRLSELLENRNIAHLKELQRRKMLLTEFLRVGKIELIWREQMTKMEKAMDSDDLDAAQNALEQLDELLSENWSDNQAKQKIVDNLRHRLVAIIRNM
jgi:hypothetical protein